MKTLELPAAQYLNECFIYVDGELHWRYRPRSHFKTGSAMSMWNSKFAGSRAGRKMTSGPYRQVGIDGTRYLEHRVIAAMHGIPTDAEIDHIDGTGNNRVENLRAATRAQNTRNTAGWSSKDSRVGVYQRGNGSWCAHIRADGRRIHLGTFKTELEAVSMRSAAEAKYYGSFAVSARTSLEAFGAQQGVRFTAQEEA